ncbi:MAG TPA: aldo/keto reductase [Candidatus Polarisedimenticolia bacterium]|nr:aldo/keto reductase [Candidatus Polarisedimenticolia bacterium]
MKLAAIEVARIGMGTNRLTNTRQNVAFIKAAVAAGVQLIDTAHLYTGGQSEETIGAALSPMPDNVVVATKGGFNDGSPAVISAEIDESLRRLRVKSIALYYLHRVDANFPIETSLGAIKEYVDRGVIRHVGVSQVTVDQIERARKVVPIAAVQQQYNLSERMHDAEVDYCTREGIPFVPFYPLHGAEGRALEELARRKGGTTRQIALAWLLKRSPVMLPIPGTLSLAHLEENLAAQNIELSDEELEALRHA